MPRINIRNNIIVERCFLIDFSHYAATVNAAPPVSRTSLWQPFGRIFID